MVIVGSTDTELLTSSANFSSYSEAVARPTFSAEDVPLYLPRLDTVHRELDDWLEHGGAGGTGSTSRRKTYRLGSVGASRAQTDFYARVAASPAVRTICEVGFNAGHSTAIWLSSNPTARVHSFDLFDHTWSMGAVRILQARFPGRLTVWKGDSLRTVPRWRAAEPGARCDLVHVDGKHSYFNAVFDFVNLQLHSHAHALYLFDDQCDPTGCDVLNWRVVSRPLPRSTRAGRTPAARAPHTARDPRDSPARRRPPARLRRTPQRWRRATSWPRGCSSRWPPCTTARASSRSSARQATARPRRCTAAGVAPSPGRRARAGRCRCCRAACRAASKASTSSSGAATSTPPTSSCSAPSARPTARWSVYSTEYRLVPVEFCARKGCDELTVFSFILHHTQLLHLASRHSCLGSGQVLQTVSVMVKSSAMPLRYCSATWTSVTFAYRACSRPVTSLSLVRHAASLQQATVLARC